MAQPANFCSPWEGNYFSNRISHRHHQWPGKEQATSLSQNLSAMTIALHLFLSLSLVYSCPCYSSRTCLGALRSPPIKLSNGLTDASTYVPSAYREAMLVLRKRKMAINGIIRPMGYCSRLVSLESLTTRMYERIDDIAISNICSDHRCLLLTLI